MRGIARIAALGAVSVVLLGACGDDDDASETGTSSTTTTTAATTTTEEAPSTTTSAAPVASDPVAAAQAFLDTHFPGNGATLSEFRQGDSQSGEIQVLRPAEGGGTANLASTLLLRLDAADEYRVIGAVNPNVTIDVPGNGTTVPAEPLTMSGVGRGFEALLVARAYDGDGRMVAEATGTGGAQAEALPYEIVLDLSAVSPGIELTIILAGGVGLENDTGEFAAVVVTVAG
jgi:hypothetical protein